jgi:hypothetical protein
MKRAILLAILVASLTFGASGSYAFPNGACAPATSQNSAMQLIWLLRPVVLAPVA